MDFHEPGDGTADDGPSIVRDDPERPPPVGWLLVGIGLVGFLVFHLWQAATYGFGDVARNVGMAVGFFVTSTLAAAGVMVLVLRRWVLPELIAGLTPPPRRVSDDGGAFPDGDDRAV